MDYQSDNRERRVAASQFLECYPEELSYYAWPQTFSSTCGPFSGFGGQSFSTFTIEAWADGRRAVLFCSGRFWKIIDKFDPRKAIENGYR